MLAEIGQPVTGSALWIAAALALVMVVAVAVIIWSERPDYRTIAEPDDTAGPVPDTGTADRQSDFERDPARAVAVGEVLASGR